MSCRSPRRHPQLREQDADVDMHDAGLATRRPSYIVVAQSARHQPQRVHPALGQHSRPPAQRLGQFRQSVVNCSHR
jgi:hypothetical protein